MIIRFYDIIIEKFQNLKMGANSINTFYSRFICLVLDLEYILKIFIWEFKYKLILYLKN